MAVGYCSVLSSLDRVTLTENVDCDPLHTKSVVDCDRRAGSRTQISLPLFGALHCTQRGPYTSCGLKPMYQRTTHAYHNYYDRTASKQRPTNTATIRTTTRHEYSYSLTSVPKTFPSSRLSFDNEKTSVHILKPTVGDVFRHDDVHSASVRSEQS